MARLYNNPRTLSDFKAIKPMHRKGLTPMQMLEKHNHRLANFRFKDNKPLSLITFIKSGYAMENLPRNCCLIPIGSSRSNFLERIHSPRKKNYTEPEPIFSKSKLFTNDLGRYSKSCTYKKYSYTPMIQSFGYLINKNTMYIRIDSNKGVISRVISSPWGYHFLADSNGLKLQSNSIKAMDYHFTALDFIVGNSQRQPMKEMVRKCKVNYQTRKQAKLQTCIFSDDPKQVNKVIREAERLKVQISVVDSLKAGNCRAGTWAWSRSNHMNINKHYQIQAIYDKLDDANKDRVKLVILRAIERTKQELARGFSLLEDHYLDYQTN
jgi:hypothetical protein